jgi:DNA-binding beta-propeller fold protein YncE
MRKAFAIAFGVLCLWCLFRATARDVDPAAASSPPQSHRTPIDIALIGDGRLALVANHTSDSVSLVDTEQGKVLVEQECGRRPVAVAVSADGTHAAVSNLWSGSLSFLAIRSQTVEKIQEVSVGAFPRGLVFARDGASLFVALAGEDEVAQVEWLTGKVLRRFAAPREPRSVALSSDGQWLAAASSKSAQVRCWNLKTHRLHWEREIGDAFNLRGLAFTPEDDAVICAHAVRRDFPVTKQNIEEGWVIDSRLTRLALSAKAVPAVWQIALDVKGQAISDPHGLAFTDRWLALTSSGTQELLLLKTTAIPWNSGDPGDFLDPRLSKADSLRRIGLGGRPMVMTYRPANDSAIVANYLLDAVQVVEVQAGKIVRTIPLGSPPTLSPARQGEALFYDARRSRNQWFSCHTCHVDGHTNGLNFDTLNDDSYGTPKLTPSLWNVTKTGPWTWHGRQKDLGASVAKSFTTTMFGPKPTPAETAAVLAFLDTLAPLPTPRRGVNNPAVGRGSLLFHEKAGCSRCHREPYYTTPGIYDVNLKAEGSPYSHWNPPSLLGLYDRGPYLHDGRAKTLNEVLQKHHTPEMLGAERLTEKELGDLEAFLFSL